MDLGGNRAAPTFPGLFPVIQSGANQVPVPANPSNPLPGQQAAQNVPMSQMAALAALQQAQMQAQAQGLRAAMPGAAALGLSGAAMPMSAQQQQQLLAQMIALRQQAFAAQQQQQQAAYARPAVQTTVPPAGGMVGVSAQAAAAQQQALYQQQYAVQQAHYQRQVLAAQERQQEQRLQQAVEDQHIGEEEDEVCRQSVLVLLCGCMPSVFSMRACACGSPNESEKLEITSWCADVSLCLYCRWTSTSNTSELHPCASDAGDGVFDLAVS